MFENNESIILRISLISNGFFRYPHSCQSAARHYLKNNQCARRRKNGHLATCKVYPMLFKNNNSPLQIGKRWTILIDEHFNSLPAINQLIIDEYPRSLYVEIEVCEKYRMHFEPLLPHSRQFLKRNNDVG